MAIRYKFFEKGDEEGLTRFSREVSGKVFPPSYWTWKYLENPAGEATVSLALDDNKIVGRFGIFPTRVKVGSEEIISGQIIETEILEDYRKLGLIYTLGRYAHEEFIRQGRGKTIIGFGTEISSRLATRFSGYSMVGPVRKMVKVLNPLHYFGSKFGTAYVSDLLENITKRYIHWKKGKLWNNNHVSEVLQFDHRFDDLWQRAAKGKVTIIRDPAYLTWRYKKCPAVNYKVYAVEKDNILGGYIITYVIKKDGLLRGNIADFLVQPGVADCAEALLGEALRCFYDQGAVTVTTWCPKGSFMYPFFQKMNFVERPTYNYLVAKSLSGDIPQELLNDENNWYYMIGDSDHNIRPDYSETAAN